MKSKQEPRGPGSNGTANPLKLVSLEIQPSSKNAIEVQLARPGGRNLNSDSSNQLFVPESPVLQVSDLAKRAVRENERLSNRLLSLKPVHSSVAPQRPIFAKESDPSPSGLLTSTRSDE
jgi:hypothetical protein